MKDESVEVNLEDVKEFLNKGSEVKLDLDPADLDVAVSKKTDEDPKQEVDTPLRAELEPDADTMANRAVWAMNLPGSLEVHVTEMDKNLFLKAALNDTALRLSINLPALPGTPITCRSLSDRETAVVFSVLDAGMADKTITNDATFRSQLQALSTYLQVESFGKAPYKYHTSIPETLSIPDAASTLLEHHTAVQSSINVPQFSMALAALRVFTVKTKLCTDNLLNENFWKPLEADSE
jgi:hypothetical protein